jgi:putative transposase
MGSQVDCPTLVYRTYRYRIYPTRRQQLALEAQFGFACDLYNAALEQRREAWRCKRRGITLYAVS